MKVYCPSADICHNDDCMHAKPHDKENVCKPSICPLCGGSVTCRPDMVIAYLVNDPAHKLLNVVRC